LIVRVATANPVKVEAVRQAFAKFFRKVRVVGVRRASAVAPHPKSFGEIMRGAQARARGVFGECDFAVGIEAGTFRAGAHLFQITMACVFDGVREVLGAGPFYELPTRKLVPTDTGLVAVVTKGRVTREQVTRDAVLMALAPFMT
jgi:inosine/xanthosine triphosphatase